MDEMVEMINNYIQQVNNVWDISTDAEQNDLLYQIHQLYTSSQMRPYHKHITSQFREPIKTRYKVYKVDRIA